MQIWPPVVDPATLTRQVWDVETARSIPGVGRALQLYGLISSCALDLYRGDDRLTRPLQLKLPDVNLRARSTFVRVQVEDYLTHGNAVHVITMRYANGAMRGSRWFPAHMWQVADPSSTPDGGVDYYLNGRLVTREDVVHVQRGAAAGEPWRGVGVVEQHLKTLNRAGLEEAAESKNLTEGGVPSVAVISPNPDITQTQVDNAKLKWLEKYSGPGREPAILPNGTQVIPLSWSPVDSDLIEARKMTLTDVANVFNLDGYWVGAPTTSMTYQSPGPNFLQLLRTSLEPVMVDFELVWSLLWLPPLGQEIRFDRLQLTRDDLSTEVQTGATAVQSGLMTREEWRLRWGMPAVPEVGTLSGSTPAIDPPEPAEDPDEDTPADDDPEDVDEDEETTA